MLIAATQKYTRQTPRKVRLVASAVRKLSIKKAIEQLSLIERKSTMVILKTLRQVLADAKHNHNLDIKDLNLKNILIEAGPTYKRFRAVSRGRAHGIFKRTCHIKVILETKQELVADQQPAKTSKTKAAKDGIKLKTAKAEEIKAASSSQPELVKTQQKMTAKKAVKLAAVKKIRTKSFGGRK